MLLVLLTAIPLVTGKGALDIRITYGVFQAIGLVSRRVRGGGIRHGEKGERKAGGRGSNRRVGSLWTLWLTGAPVFPSESGWERAKGEERG